MNLNSYLENKPRGESARIARGLGVPRSVFSAWRYGTKKIPAARCVQIEQITGGMVGRKDLRPDDFAEIWPELKENQE